MNTRNDAAFIRDTDRWPCWPRLPVKRMKPGATWPELGLILAGQLTTVILAGLYDAPEKISGAETVHYGSVEGVIADGWVVD
jgi:hypothetical protein